MAAERTSMRKIREVLRLRFGAGLSYRQIARSLKLSHSVVGNYIAAATAAGLCWPLPDGLDDDALLRAVAGATPVEPAFAQPDFARLHQELKRKGVTRYLLWQEYREAHPDDAYSYSQFCFHYQIWRDRLGLSMRQTHQAGEKLFVDFAGKGVEVRVDGQVRIAQIFVAALGASSYTYAEAVWTQGLPDWIGAHVRAFSFLGGVTRLVVPDNVLAGIREACYYEPDINPTYQQMADHYGTAILPTRPRKPKDKAKAEVGVQVVQRWVLARLRNRQFFSLSELNAAIRELITDLNDRPFKKLPGSRRSAFDALDRRALLPLPTEPYEYEQWSATTVGLDYHVEVSGHAYSVPYRLVRERVEIRLTSSTVEILHKHKRVASHPRSSVVGGHTTLASHRPAAHRAHAEWTPERLLAWAAEIGPSTLEVVSRMMVEKPHPEHGYRACLGLRKLSRRYTSERLEAACRRTLLINAPTYRSVESILKQGIDRLALPGEADVETCDLVHENVRGAEYYRESASEEERPC